MKKLFLLFALATAFMSCEKDSEELQVNQDNNTIVGRWNVVGFEDTVMYQFTEDLRHTIYSTDGNFGDINTAIPNPKEWYYEDNKLVVDLNFGNFLRVSTEFRCNGNVVDFINEDGAVNSTLFREGYDISNCQ